MPFKKISDLPAGVAQGGELIPATQSGTTRRLSVGQGVGQVPFIGPNGLRLFHAKGLASVGSYISTASGSGMWFRLATFNLPSNYTGTRLIFLIDRGGADVSIPVRLMVYAWRTSTAVPPVPYVYVGLEPASVPRGAMLITDACVVETSPGILEVWVKQFADTGYDYAVFVIGTSNTDITLESYTVSRSAAPPTPTTGGANVYWSTDTNARLWTGRIVNAGSGSNGSYIRFSDGTQIAQHTIPSSSFGSQLGSGTFADPYLRLATWTYPAAFSATPVVQVAVESTASGIVVARMTTRSSTSANIRVEYAANNAAFTANLLAIGRWY